MFESIDSMQKQLTMLRIVEAENKKCSKVCIISHFSRLSGVRCVDIQCCDQLSDTDLLLPSSRVKYQPRDSRVKFETSLPGDLILEKYQEMRDNNSQNTTFNINVSKEELLMMAHQASKIS